MTAPPEQRQKPDPLAATEGFFRHLGLFETLPESADKKDFFSDLIRSILNVDRVEPGRITCTLTVRSTVTNPYNTLHGGAVAAVAEMVSLACAKTAAGDKDFFLGESSTAYLSAARLNEDVKVDASILRQGRNVVVTSVDFRTKKTGKLLFTSRSTFYIMPVSSL
ncbi:hypothetical protein OPV22_002937 [Ensete ventricosum]|uniref:Thioesterase domain-containing protein n=1 Tax=Ensete ventricosum TaxID=4639 RepID=A0AAV8RZC8_ENSVE|nr:hypothetical protein OPV22_002937 [Ensete ventricosum]